jgi:predicted ATP-grasp superfamily ATP-dependent carboligase
MGLLLGGYFWAVTSGNDQFILKKGKWVYEALVSWFEDADLDFQLKKDQNKKNSRRWH